MKSRVIDMIIDMTITVLCAALVIFNAAYLWTVEPQVGTGFQCVMSVLAVSVGAVGVCIGVWSVASYFTEK